MTMILPSHLGNPHPDSPGEHLLAFAVAHGLFGPHHAWRCNTFIDGYSIDLVHTDLRLAVMVDGFTFHSDPDSHTKDLQCTRDLTRHGWRALRFSHQEVITTPLAVINEIADTVRDCTAAYPPEVACDDANATDTGASAPIPPPRRRYGNLAGKVNNRALSIAKTIAVATGCDARLLHWSYNSDLKERYGANKDRSTEARAAALNDLDAIWDQARHDHGLTNDDLLPPDVTVCAVCRSPQESSIVTLDYCTGICSRTCLDQVAAGHSSDPDTVAHAGRCSGCNATCDAATWAQWHIDDTYRWWCPTCRSVSTCANPSCGHTQPTHYHRPGDEPRTAAPEVLCAACMTSLWSHPTFAWGMLPRVRNSRDRHRHRRRPVHPVPTGFLGGKSTADVDLPLMRHRGRLLTSGCS